MEINETLTKYIHICLFKLLNKYSNLNKYSKIKKYLGITANVFS